MQHISQPALARHILASSKIAVAFVLAASLTAGSLLPSASALAQNASTLRGGVIVTDDTPTGSQVNPDEQVTLEHGDTISVKVATLLGADLSREGDEFFGRINKDFTVDGKLVLPRGTLIHGIVEGVTEPKRMGRNGHMQMKFDYLITPDGREVPINGDHDTKGSKGKEALRVAGRAAGFTLAGGAIGALMVLKYGGAVVAAASEGYALLGGAAVGAGVGLTAAMLTKGKYDMLQPGAEMEIQLADGVTLPTMTERPPDELEIKLDGLAVDVQGKKVDKDPFGIKRELTLSLDISNLTPNTFSTFDMALVDENGSTFHPSPFGDTGIWFGKLKPNSRLRGNLSFSVDDPEAMHYLVFYKQYSREILARIPIDITPTEEIARADQKKSKKHKGRRGKKDDEPGSFTMASTKTKATLAGTESE